MVIDPKDEKEKGEVPKEQPPPDPKVDKSKEPDGPQIIQSPDLSTQV